MWGRFEKKKKKKKKKKKGKKEKKESKEQSKGGAKEKKSLDKKTNLAEHLMIGIEPMVTKTEKMLLTIRSTAACIVSSLASLTATGVQMHADKMLVSSVADSMWGRGAGSNALRQLSALQVQWYRVIQELVRQGKVVAFRQCEKVVLQCFEVGILHSSCMFCAQTEIQATCTGTSTCAGTR